MKIDTDRLKFEELTYYDVSKIENIARNMAWNDTINLLLENNIEVLKKYPNVKELINYRSKIIEQTELLKKLNISNSELYAHISQSLIPEKYWHINFSMLNPDFRKSAFEFINAARQKEKEHPRTGYWFSIKNKETGEIMGATMISTKVLNKDGIECIGHSGQFIDPKFQRKGYISETKAVMVDFMYRYLIDEKKSSISSDTVFLTTCDVLNKAAQMLQLKSGAHCINKDNPIDGKYIYHASREDIMNSDLLKRHRVGWKAIFSDGSIFTPNNNNSGFNMNSKNLNFER